MKQIAVALFAQFLCAFPAHSQDNPFDPKQTVVPITTVKLDVGLGIGARLNFGTGFCLDVKCRYIGTNYHVAIGTGTSLKIKGERTTERYLYSSPDDEGAVFMEDLDSGVHPMKFNPSRDLAFYALKRPLANKGFHGVTFNLDELEEHQAVDIFAYPLANQFRVKRDLTKFSAEFAGATPDGLLVFRYQLSERGQKIKGGASGGLVVDHNTHQIVGILNGASNTTPMATAISIQNLADFLKKSKPELYAEMFPSARYGLSKEQTPSDIYPRYVPVANENPGMGARREEPPEVRLLRKKADELTDNIRDFIAIQTTTYGGMRVPPQPTQYEIRVIDGEQRFREYPNGRRERERVRLPDVDPVLLGSTEWSTMPFLLGTDLSLKIVEAKDLVMGDKRLKVFQFYGAAEDKACSFDRVYDYIVFSRTTSYGPSCGGEVWTDEKFNILRISETYDLPPEAQWKNLRAVASYGWLERASEATRLIPFSYVSQAEYKGKTYWCHERFTNYRVFSTRSKLLEAGFQPAAPKTVETERAPNK
jgi:hypothetical protein